MRVGSALGILALLQVGPLSGCGGEDPMPDTTQASIREYCTGRARCEGGNERDINACVASFNGTTNQAAAHGCRAPYSLVLQCLFRGGRCTMGRFGAECSNEQAAANDCMAAGARN